MNKDRIEEFLTDSLSKLELARDHAASAGNDKAYNRLNDLCANVSDLLDDVEDDKGIVISKPQYTAEQAQILYDVLAQHDASTLQPEANLEHREKIDSALAKLRMELASYIAQEYYTSASDISNQDEYNYDEPVDGQ